MIKYINAELLKEGLKELESVIYSDQLVGQSMHPHDGGQLHAINIIKELIDSLEQEQPCDTCTNDKGCVTCKDGELWEGEPADIDFEKEQERNLDFQCFAKEMDSIFALPAPKTTNTNDEPLNWEYAIARHFYELGKNSK